MRSLPTAEMRIGLFVTQVASSKRGGKAPSSHFDLAPDLQLGRDIRVKVWAGTEHAVTIGSEVPDR